MSPLRTTVLFFSVLLAIVSGCRNGHPADENLRGLFLERRPTFEKLAEMLENDAGIQTVTVEGVSYVAANPTGIPKQRLDMYQNTLGALGSPGIQCIRRYDGTLLFLLSFKGLVVGGSVKGIAYVPGKNQLGKFTVLPSLDKGLRKLEEGEYVKRIDGDWYVYFGK
jgi:hypothetical protein